MLQAVLLCPPVAGSSGFGQGICRAARGATVCGDVGAAAGASHEIARPRIGTQRISPDEAGAIKAQDPPERVDAPTASRHPKNPEHFSRERAPALPLDASSQHPGGEQPGRTGTAPAGDRQENQLWIAVRARLEDARGAHERAPHPEQTNRKPICHFHQGAGCAHDQPNAKSLSTVVQFFLTRSNPAVTDALQAPVDSACGSPDFLQRSGD